MAPALGEIYRDARERFEQAGLTTPDLDARLLVTEFLDIGWTDLMIRAETEIPAEKAEALQALVARRLSGEPVHRILGHREFYGLDLKLSSATLEPRPDTETLIEAVRPFVLETVGIKGGCRVLDLGTGTGAIALSLLSLSPDVTAVATDISPAALETAQENADISGMADRFTGIVSDWFAEVEGEFDLIVSNPPYIARAAIESLAPDVRLFDPMAALDGGLDGLAAYRVIAADAANHLAKKGMVAVEIGHDQRQTVAALFSDAGFALASAHRDFGGNHRALLFRPHADRG